MTRLRLTTCSLGGCFGCHMSFLDIDERLLSLVDLYDLRRSPLTDIREIEPCDVALIEGGACNEENLHTLRALRANTRLLVAVGACAINGGVPAMRNHLQVEDCLRESYLDGMGVINPRIPDDPELPRLLPIVMPLHEVVHVDHFLPGCPPPADAFMEILLALHEGREPVLAYPLRRFD
jgi:NAD-reducing hydrogenase small subunit